jgi:hypothetical protein
LYAVPTVPPGNEVVVITGAGGFATVIDNVGGVVSVRESESVTCGVKVNVPIAVGVPDITPVDGVKVKLGGSVPVTLQVTEPVPSLFWRV